jgi:ribose 1,5-bisphosphokinase
MNAKLIYVVGPSGAGKDSLLNWLRMQLPAQLPIAWARRTINRACTADGELHESVATTQFNRLFEGHEFAMHWAANEHLYGIRHTELGPLTQQQWVFVNGSRAHLPQAAQRYPGLTVLHITAEIEVLRQRLLGRGRESHEAIESRLHRNLALRVPPGCKLIEIHNHDSLESSGQQLLQALRALPNWPTHE